ncbi:MAG TPA: phosphatidate cytidylyltransferase [Xanthobacteraceae bacterium]
MTELHIPQEQGEPARRAGELGKRVASAVALGVVALATAWYGGIPFLIVWTVGAFAVWWEWSGIIRADPRSLVVAIGWVALAGMAVALARDAAAIAFVCAVIGAAVAMATAQPGRGWAAAGVFYASAVLIPMVMLRNGPEFGLIAILWLFAVVWAGDTGAYFAGRLIGGPKLAPGISPNKTWAGAVGGAIAGVAAGSLLLFAAGLALRPMHFVVAFAISVAAQIGDLLESAVKRRFGMKDAGTLVPGHGGLMDRVDGLLFAATAAVAIGLARGGATPANGLLSW